MIVSPIHCNQCGTVNFIPMPVPPPMPNHSAALEEVARQEAHLEDVLADLDDAKREKGDVEDQIAEKREQLKQLESQIETATKGLASIRKTANEIIANVREVREEIGREKQTLATLVTNKNTAMKEINRFMAKVEESRKEATRTIHKAHDAQAAVSSRLQKAEKEEQRLTTWEAQMRERSDALKKERRKHKKAETRLAKKEEAAAASTIVRAWRTAAVRLILRRAKEDEEKREIILKVYDQKIENMEKEMTDLKKESDAKMKDLVGKNVKLFLDQKTTKDKIVEHLLETRKILAYTKINMFRGLFLLHASLMCHPTRKILKFNDVRDYHAAIFHRLETYVAMKMDIPFEDMSPFKMWEAMYQHKGYEIMTMQEVMNTAIEKATSMSFDPEELMSFILVSSINPMQEDEEDLDEVMQSTIDNLMKVEMPLGEEAYCEEKLKSP